MRGAGVASVAPGSPWWERAVPLLLGACALIVFLLPVLRGTLTAGFPLDDGWIHATYARNLAARGEFAFNAGEPSTGTTSLLWTLLLGGALHTGGGAVWTACVLASVMFLFLIFTWHGLLLRAGGGRGAALFGAVVLPLSGIVTWWTLSGMETVLFLLLAVLAIDAYARGRHARSGGWTALLILTRPEGILLLPVLAFAAWRRGDARRDVTLLAAAAACGAAVYVLWNLAVGGAPWTSTFAGRRWLALGGRPPADDIIGVASAIATMLFRWLRTVLWGMLRWAPTGTWIAAGAAALALCTGPAHAIVRSLRGRSKAPRTADDSADRARPRPRGWSAAAVLAAWSVLHTLAYALFLPYPGHAARYLAPLLLCAALLLSRMLALQPPVPRTHGPAELFFRHLLPAALPVAAAALIGWAALGSWSCAWRSGVDHINSVHRRAAVWIAVRTPTAARVAAYDIGAIGFFSGRRVIDLGGLVHPAVQPFMDGRIDAYILASGADVVAMIAPREGTGAEGFLPHALGYGRSGRLHTTRIAEFSYPENLYRRHIAVTGNAYPRLIIDRVKKKL
jgi:hypothetical protein